MGFVLWDFTMVHNDYYVYLHRRGDNNEVFYVGKGRGKRSTTTSGRNKWWKNVYNKHGFTVEHVETGMCEEDAFSLEVELIKFYRENNHVLCNLSSGGEGASGCARSKEHREAVGNSRRGVLTSEETKIKMAEQGHSILCSNGMTFPSARRAALWVRQNTKHAKAHYGTILKVCKGISPIAFGLFWSYDETACTSSQICVQSLHQLANQEAYET